MLDVGCSSYQEIPHDGVDFWVGSPSQKSILRLQDKKKIMCEEPVFSDYFCLKDTDIMELLDSCN